MTKFHCPLCKSLLTKSRYYQVTRLADAQAKAEQEIREQLKEAVAKQKIAIKQMEREKRLAIKEGIEKGKQKEKATANRLARRLQKQAIDLQNADSKIRELEKHLKNGTNPQDAGRDFEKELVKQLQKEFPTDRIEHTGKGGDIFHRIISKSKEIGSILYECKKTAKFLPDYIHQTKRAISTRNATYGVLVTFASRKNSQGFFVDNDIIVVHPFGTVYIARILRSSLVEMQSLKLSHKELKDCGQNLLGFIKSDDFKNSVENTIYRTKELAKLLLQEHKDHVRNWGKRFDHYNSIHGNTSGLQIATKNILNGISINKKLIKTEIKQLPAPELSKYPSGKVHIS